jgi:hypothetical protein
MQLANLWLSLLLIACCQLPIVFKTAAKLLHSYPKIIMKNSSSIWLSALVIATTLSSCELVGGILKAGIWIGILIVVFVVALILWLVNRFRR